MEDPQGPVRSGRRSPAPRIDRPAGGRGGAGAGARGDLPRPAAPVRCPRLRGTGDLRPRQGRQHPLPAQRAAGHLLLASGGLHRRHGRSGARPRRQPQGRARHRTGDGTLRRAPVRSGAVRRDARDQDAGGPDWGAEPWGGADRGPVGPYAESQARGRGRGGGRPLRGVRLLRAGVPQQGPDPDAAAADRPAPRRAAGNRPWRPRHRRRDPRGLRVSGQADLRSGRDVPGGLSGGHQHRRSGAPPARRGRRSGREGRLGRRCGGMGHAHPRGLVRDQRRRNHAAGAATGRDGRGPGAAGPGDGTAVSERAAPLRWLGATARRARPSERRDPRRVSAGLRAHHVRCRRGAPRRVRRQRGR